LKLVLNNNNKTNSSSNSHNNKDYVKLGLLMIVIATAAYIAVVLLFGFSINTMTAAEGFTPIPTSVVYYAAAAATTSIDYNTIRGNITGVVIHIVDGDTLDLDINNGTITRIRFSLVNTPELGEPGYKEAKDFVAATCPVGSIAIFDADNGQKLSFGRVVGVVYCVGSSSGSSGSNTNYSNNILINLNQALLQNKYAEPVTRFCDVSEFSDTIWIKDQCGSSNISKQTGK
jgi:endonuclease YncB( thermonuclease family)